MKRGLPIVASLFLLLGSPRQAGACTIQEGIVALLPPDGANGIAPNGVVRGIVAHLAALDAAQVDLEMHRFDGVPAPGRVTLLVGDPARSSFTPSRTIVQLETTAPLVANALYIATLTYRPTGEQRVVRFTTGTNPDASRPFFSGMQSLTATYHPAPRDDCDDPGGFFVLGLNAEPASDAAGNGLLFYRVHAVTWASVPSPSFDVVGRFTTPTPEIVVPAVNGAQYCAFMRAEDLFGNTDTNGFSQCVTLWIPGDGGDDGGDGGRTDGGPDAGGRVHVEFRGCRCGAAVTDQAPPATAMAGLAAVAFVLWRRRTGRRRRPRSGEAAGAGEAPRPG